MLPFGRYEGQPLEIVPTQYLVWFLRECTNVGPEVVSAVKEQLLMRKTMPPCAPDEVDVCELIRTANDRFHHQLEKMKKRITAAQKAELESAWRRLVGVFTGLMCKIERIEENQNRAARRPSAVETLRRIVEEGPARDFSRG